MSVKTGQGGIAFAGGLDTADAYINLVTAPLTLTNLPAAINFVASSNAYMYLLDLRPARQVRLTSRVSTVSAVAGNRIKLMYAAAFTTTPANFLDLGESEVANSVFTGADGAMQDSGWINLAAGARVESAIIGLMGIGGNGATSPIINGVTLHIR